MGIVNYVKTYTQDKYGTNKKQNGVQELSSHIDMESTNDKSRFKLFIKHSPKVNLKGTIFPGMVLLIKDATRKISNTLDIYVQMHFAVQNFRVIGRVKDSISEF